MPSNILSEENLTVGALKVISPFSIRVVDSPTLARIESLSCVTSERYTSFISPTIVLKTLTFLVPMVLISFLISVTVFDVIS